MTGFGERGFTLIELLVVIAVIGILASIAVPQFDEYRSRSFDARAESDLRNAINSQEAKYADDESYVACSGAGCNTPTLPGFRISDGVEIALELAEDGAAGFNGTASHPKGSKEFSYSSATGLIVDTGLAGSGSSL